MNTWFTLLFYLSSVYHVWCGLVPEQDVSQPTYANKTLTTASEEVGNNLTTVEQMVVRKADMVNASDILLSKEEFSMANTSVEAKEPSEVVAPLTAANDSTGGTVAIGNEIIVPKEAIDNTTLELVVPSAGAIVVPKTAIANGSAGNETGWTNGSPATSETVQPNQGLGPISVHKRSVDSSGDYPDTSSALFEKYDKWNGTGAVTSEERKEMQKDHYFVKREAPVESAEALTNDLIQNEDSQDTDNDMTTTILTTLNNVTNNTEPETQDAPVKAQLQENEPVDDGSGICAVDKEDEEATRLVTIFWRTIFCVIFVIIIVYPIYSYTKIYCQKRKKDAESVSTKQFVDSESESSNTDDSPMPTPAK